MIMLNKLINKRKLKKLKDKESWDPMQDIKHLMCAGLSQGQALAIVNAISNSKK